MRPIVMSGTPELPDTEIQFAVRSAELPVESEVAHWVRIAREGTPGALCVRFVDAGEARELNRTYRGLDRATNVLSFPAESMPPELPPLLGDIVVCAPVVEAEARAQGKRPVAHYAHMIVHGVLHLRGFDHERCAEAAAMEGRERALLTVLGFDDPYPGEHLE